MDKIKSSNMNMLNSLVAMWENTLQISRDPDASQTTP
jgi:hypothetical protein